MPDPAALVLDYLRKMEARELDDAQKMLGQDFEMIFPGPTRIGSLADLMTWAAPRYRHVSKTYEATETLAQADKAIVYTRGTLSGAWPDGTPFEGIRFIDRFEVTGGKITRHEVWNDLAKVRAP